ncbi:MAG: ATP-dependent sacrificial sulfur transferase LarE [Chloroflexota bacterium]
MRQAEHLAAAMGVRLIHLETNELDDERFAANPPERCYYCKSELFAKLSELAAANGLKYLLDGANADDVADFRPGTRAEKEFHVRSPLREAGLTKDEIRALSRHFGLPNWDKPSFACLSTRFPYGVRITEEKLTQIDESERFMRALGVGQLRVRHHGEIARIEVSAPDIELVIRHRAEIAAKLKSLGFAYVTLDLLGYRTGSMNETLSDETKRAAL